MIQREAYFVVFSERGASKQTCTSKGCFPKKESAYCPFTPGTGSRTQSLTSEFVLGVFEVEISKIERSRSVTWKSDF